MVGPSAVVRSTPGGMVGGSVGSTIGSTGAGGSVGSMIGFTGAGGAGLSVGSTMRIGLGVAGAGAAPS